MALSGDRSPFSNSGVPLKGPVGFKVVRVEPDVSNGAVNNFIANTRGIPAHLLIGREQGSALERPVDVKVGPDGSVYVLDMGPMRVENGQEKIPTRGGRIFRCGLPIVPATQPASTAPGTNPEDRYFRP